MLSNTFDDSFREVLPVLLEGLDGFMKVQSFEETLCLGTHLVQEKLLRLTWHKAQRDYKVRAQLRCGTYGV